MQRDDSERIERRSDSEAEYHKITSSLPFLFVLIQTIHFTSDKLIRWLNMRQNCMFL